MYTKETVRHNIVKVNPLPSQEDLKNYYERQYYQNADGKKTTYDVIYTEDEIQHKILESKLAVEALNQYFGMSSAPLSVVEFGCGEGFFLNEAAACGWRIKGSDFSQFGIEKWHPHLLDRFEAGDFYDHIERYVVHQERFDVCVLKNVLEHVLNPEYLLKMLKKILTPNGVLLITVPNDYSELQKLAIQLRHIDREFWFAPPDHLYYFNTKNIAHFLEDQGLTMIDIYSSFPIDFFLFHPGSNYIQDRSKGKSAHFARVQLDLLMSASGLNKMLDVYRALANCGIGRDITVLAKV